MKIYVNYNFCGYRWYYINDVFQQSVEKSITLNEWTGDTNVPPVVFKLMLYDSYNLAYMNVDGHYILALRHINETGHTDIDGRKLLMTYIFEGQETERKLMDKIALTYINHKEILDKTLSSAISSTIDSVTYDVSSLLSFLAAVKNVKSITNFCFGRGKVLLLLSKWQNSTIADNLHLDIKEFASVKHTMDEYADIELVEMPQVGKYSIDELTKNDDCESVYDYGYEENTNSSSSCQCDLKPLVKSPQIVLKDCEAIRSFCQKHLGLLLLSSFAAGFLLGYVISSCSK